MLHKSVREQITTLSVRCQYIYQSYQETQNMTEVYLN